jgi:cytoskeleton protein RodZ
MGLSVGDVANQIKFAPRQIEALEADDFSAKPEAMFLRGFVRSYGRLLRLDEAALFALLPETKVNTLTAAPAPNQTIFPTAQSNLRKNNLVWMSAALLLVAVAVGFSVMNSRSPVVPDEKVGAEDQIESAVVENPVTLPSEIQTVAQQVDDPAGAASAVVSALPAEGQATHPAEQTPVQPPEEKTVVEAPPAPPKKPKAVAAKSVQETSQPVAPVAAAVEPSREVIPIDMLLGTAKPSANPDTSTAPLRIVFGEESWAEVRDKHGKNLSSKINAGGSELNLQGSPPYTLVISHAKSARLFYKGKQVDLTRHIGKYSTSDVARLTLE